MIHAEHLSYSLPDRYLYRDATFSIHAGAHCVLIGANGTGKTTLIDLLLHPDDYLFKGKVRTENINRIGYVNQFVRHEKDRQLSVYEYLCEDFEKLQAKIDFCCSELEQSSDDPQILEQYQTALDEFSAVDGYQYSSNIYHMLKTAELEGIDTLPLSSISGGEYKLVQIIRQMLLLPDLLVMDEPDVFLDFENLNSLRQLINSYTGTILIATHNRYLLNHCFDKVLQIENQNVQEYEGNYTDFSFTQLQMKIAMQELHSKESEYIAFQEAVVERMRKEATEVISPRKGKVLHARVSYVEHWKARHVKEPYLESRVPLLRFPETSLPEPKPEYILQADDYDIVFPDGSLLEQVSFTILPGEKVALVGANGTGKSTMLHDILSGEKGSIRLHPDVRTGFLSQFHGDTLSENDTVWSCLEKYGFPNPDSAADYLQDFCFDPEAMHRPVKTLSGGERNLLGLAFLGLEQNNLLLLDEPTSHLDLRAQIALENALNAFTGTVLMVSHDFYSIANIADYVLFAENHTIRRMSIRSFRRMIYKNHFPLNYLELEQQKKDLELQITAQLRNNQYESAKLLCQQLDEVIGSLETCKSDSRTH